MSQHDFSISNQLMPAARLDINQALDALVSLSSGGASPSTTFPNQLWFDESNSVLRQRKLANDGWIDIARVDQTSGRWVPASISTFAEAFVAVSSAAAARTALGVFIPTSGAGPGNWQAIFADGGLLTLPAGGTWAYFSFALPTNGYGFRSGGSAGVAAGGTQVRAFTDFTSGYMLCWRIA
ncbi:hypothetical protein [Frigidibacter sp. MR17.24]|uniref:hypothetical protein n=1 Tax=Frigidibacter sp. MR17.24 TaxID=3127345 RepID=UPI003012D444